MLLGIDFCRSVRLSCSIFQYDKGLQMPHAYLLRALPETGPVPTSQLPPLDVGLNRFCALIDAQAVCLRKYTEHLRGETVELHHLVAEKSGSENIKILCMCHAFCTRLCLVPSL